MTRRATVPVTATPSRWSRTLLASVALLLAAGALGCAAASREGEQGWFVRYERVWPDGLRERQEIWPDGRLLMWHGDYLERLTLGDEDVARLQSGLEADIPVGSPEDSPQRSMTLSDGTLITAPRPDPGTVTEMLEQLLDRHTLSP